jgi:hypothetical protein
VAERLEDREHRAEAALSPPVGDFVPTLAFAYFFVKFDRKQNTRLWPFVLELHAHHHFALGQQPF